MQLGPDLLAGAIMDASEDRITLIGAGTIGISLAALHLQHLTPGSHLTILDVQPNIEQTVSSALRKCLPASFHSRIAEIRFASTVAVAVKDSTVVQESGPEDLKFKTALWEEVEKHVPSTALLWTSTSGILASRQADGMRDKTRLLVVHPFNPPHVLPLLEIVPSPETSASVIERTMQFWHARGREPILLAKEITGFVAGRLAWVLLREAIHLVDQNVVTVQQLDRIVETSMGPRWAYAGPFKSFHTGGGPGGLEALLKNIRPTVQACWDEGGKVNLGDGWEDKVFSQTKEAYGQPDLEERDMANMRVLEAVQEAKRH